MISLSLLLSEGVIGTGAEPTTASNSGGASTDRCAISSASKSSLSFPVQLPASAQKTPSATVGSVRSG
jgi:hypothetical protein